jgi:HAD superfamily hydrolase (TIGR01509 family)
MKLKAVIFDVDGTLLDSRAFIFEAYEYALKKYGHNVPKRDVLAEQVTCSLQDAYTLIAEDGDLDLLTAAHLEYQEKNLHHITGYSGLHDMLADLQTAGLSLGLCSSRYKNLIPSLELCEILESFDVVISGGDVAKHKPHPEGVLSAIRALDVSPKQTAMIGDSWVDIAAGKAAQVAFTIGITHGFSSRERLEQEGADYIVEYLREIPPLLLEGTAP